MTGPALKICWGTRRWKGEKAAGRMELPYMRSGEQRAGSKDTHRRSTWTCHVSYAR